LDKALDFASDPLGYLATKAQEGAHALLSAVLPALVDITHPNLSVQGFYDAYRLSSALAVFLAIFFLLRTFMDLAANRVSGTAVAETVTFYFPGFLVAVMFGPAAANALLAGSGQLTKELVNWAVGSSVDQVTTRVLDAIKKDSAASFIGGSFVALLVYVGLLLACVLIMLTMITLAVTQYLTGVAFPLGAAWFVHPAKRHLGWRIVYVWVGIAATPPLLFLMLGAGFRLVDSLTRQFPSGVLSTLVQLLVVIIVLVLVSTTPLLLMRFAPVLPGLAGSGASVGSGSGEGGGNSGDSQMGRLSREGADSGPGEEADSSAPSLSDRVRAHHEPGTGSTTSPGSGAPTGPRAPSGPRASSGSGLGRAAAPASEGAAAEGAAGAGPAGAEGAGVGAAGAGVGGAGAGAGAGVAGGVVAAEAGGGAVASTGVGAPVGLAIMGVAAVVGGTAMAVQAVVEQGQAGADMAADHTLTDPEFEDRN